MRLSVQNIIANTVGISGNLRNVSIAGSRFVAGCKLKRILFAAVSPNVNSPEYTLEDILENASPLKALLAIDEQV